jgi:hypothetical protein
MLSNSSAGKSRSSAMVGVEVVLLCREKERRAPWGSSLGRSVLR